MTNQKILNAYLQGFKDELNQKQYKQFKNKKLKTAYNLGQIHAILGDEITTIDKSSNEDILKQIAESLNDFSSQINCHSYLLREP